jgi:hypothetical protein
MASYKKERVGSIDMGKLEGSPEVVIRRLRTLVQTARKSGYTNLQFRRAYDSDAYTGGIWDSLELYGFKPVTDSEEAP